jgi:hypothetical protein
MALLHSGMIDWTELETRIGLDALPAFHRAFLVSRGVDVTGMMLRRVQQTVEREINKLVLEGKARREDDRTWIDPSVLETLELTDGREIKAVLELERLELERLEP